MSTATATAVRRPRRLTTFTTTWSSQIGITAAFVLLWLAFVFAAPRTFQQPGIYLSFAQTTPYFAIVAMALTMVIVAGDIDLSFPSIMALGMVGFVFVWRATGSVELGVVAALLVGPPPPGRVEPQGQRLYEDPWPRPVGRGWCRPGGFAPVPGHPASLSQPATSAAP